MPRTAVEQRVHRRTIPDAIMILLALRIKARMKIRLGAHRLHHPNVRRQKGIECTAQLRPIHRSLIHRQIHMRHHAQRVHAGVRAAGTVHPFHGRKQLLHGLLHPLLHSHLPLLHLPAVIARAIVGNGELEPFHPAKLSR